jgi:hypothetical protein
VHWVDQCTATHIEVKVGDHSFEKTYETARSVEAENLPTIAWRHLVLLLPWQVAAWEEAANERTEVGIVTWEDVTVCLRRELWEPSESITWRVWAATFAAAIEQTLLGMPHIASDELSAYQQRDQAKNTIRRLPIMVRARRSKERK